MAQLTVRKVVRRARAFARRVVACVRRLKPTAWREYRAAVGNFGPDQVVFTKGHWYAFEVDATATRSLAHQINYREVARALNAGGVKFAVVSTDRYRPFDVAVHADDWRQAVDALIAGLAHRPAYASIRGPHRWADPVHLGSATFSNRSGAGSEIKVHILTKRSKKSRLNGAAAACSVRAWSPTTSRLLLSAPGANATATHVPANAFETLRLDSAVDREPEPRFAEATATDDLSVQFPIDLVYLWVDGSDPEWIRQREEVESASRAHERSTGEWLYRDRNELMYSMRSVEEFAPWVRKIHLFTASQVPRWLDVDHPKIAIHSHSEVFANPQALPTYNSHAIGSQIHHIPDLSSHYLVMNDDVLFGAPVRPEDFFSPAGVARVRFSRRHAAIAPPELLSPIESARLKTAGIIEQLHGIRPSRLFAHAPIPQVKAAQFELEEKFGDEFDATQLSQFRDPEDIVIVSWLGLYHLLYSGRAVESEIGYQYFYCTTPEVRSALVEALSQRDTQVICVNDGDEAGNVDRTDWLSGALNSAFPVRSEFELPRGQWRNSVQLE